MGSEKPDVIVLGGGFAGLSCAVALADKGRKVLVLDKKPHLGGRAYSFNENGLDIDNGQHLFMGCYLATRKFLKTIGTEGRLDIYEDVVVDYAEAGGKRDRLACPSWLPAPLHLAAGLLGLKGVSLMEKTALAAFDRSLKSMKSGPIPEAVEKLSQAACRPRCGSAGERRICATDRSKNCRAVASPCAMRVSRKVTAPDQSCRPMAMAACCSAARRAAGVPPAGTRRVRLLA